MERVTVSLVKTQDGVEVVCPLCKAVIFKVQDERMAIWNAEKAAKHECA
jgi:hypothetical protein